MKDSQLVSVSGIRNTAPRHRAKRRTFADIALITSWIIIYNLILAAFRFASFLEGLRSDHHLDSSAVRVERTMKDLPSG
jgi:hypothetical protein